jgi:hypothetical protein
MARVDRLPAALTWVSRFAFGPYMLSGKHGEAMAVEEHPLYPAWNEALERLVEAERRYHIAKMENRTDSEMQSFARGIDEARQKYRTISDEVEAYDSPRS